MFLACVAELLKLNKEERRKLSWAYSYGQLRPSEKEMEIIEGFRSVL